MDVPFVTIRKVSREGLEEEDVILFTIFCRFLAIIESLRIINGLTRKLAYQDSSKLRDSDSVTPDDSH